MLIVPFASLAAIVLFAVLAVVAANAVYNGDGRPGCQTAEELAPNAFWRHSWDQSAFWKCETQGVNAVYGRCEELTEGRFTAFSPQLRECIDQADWVWEAPVAPLSPADPNQA